MGKPTSTSRWIGLGGAVLLLAACAHTPAPPAQPDPPAMANTRPVIYQMFTRLFGNQATVNAPWGTVEQNGVGKFADINHAALESIRELGASHVWYTGVLHHAMVTDYSADGISADDPDVVKGRAGSPYAIKDYYNVDPDLAVDPRRRLDEFRDLIRRTHAHGLQVIIDIVPNHVARRYQSAHAPAGVRDLGADDDRSVVYARDNNFYYIPGSRFQVPQWPAGFQVLGGQPHPLADGQFEEIPARWTGNGSRKAQPAFDDWYETVKLNFGVRPDGSHDFPELPADYAARDNTAHVAFWIDKDVPDTWTKFRAITDFWLDQGVDGFRYDMAEMVPVAFWSYLNSHIKAHRPDALLIAEVYNPAEYRNYLRLGRMDVLYDKVGFYDTLKAVMQGKAPARALFDSQARVADIAPHLLHFLENHDEQRIASPQFVGDARIGQPAMLVAATISAAPTLLYFGQDVGEAGALACGFGQPSRTTLFDYCGVPAHQRWMNGGRFDGGGLSAGEKQLRDFYRRLLRFAGTAPALRGDSVPLDVATTNDQLIAYARSSTDQQLLVVANLGSSSSSVELSLPAALIAQWRLADGRYPLVERLGGHDRLELTVLDGVGHTRLQAGPLAGLILELER